MQLLLGMFDGFDMVKAELKSKKTFPRKRASHVGGVVLES
jgi:hypothetical protein